MNYTENARKDRLIKFLAGELSRITALAKAQKSTLQTLCQWTNWECVVATFEPQEVKEISPFFAQTLHDVLTSEDSHIQLDQAWMQRVQTLVDEAF